MPYDEKLAERLRTLLAKERNVTEKKMFGGIGFIVRGNMCVSASGKGGILVRIDPEESDAAIARPHATLMEMGGRKMAGWIRVDAAGLKSERELESWVRRALEYVKTLPAK
jgi:TfoX/Sxy family transcriptional regulator of competence genes